MWVDDLEWGWGDALGGTGPVAGGRWGPCNPSLEAGTIGDVTICCYCKRDVMGWGKHFVVEKESGGYYGALSWLCLAVSGVFGNSLPNIIRLWRR